jgi:succinate dehydrogenase hydrophobic anchor subunit
MRNTYLQILQLITGVCIAVLLGIHMVITHLDAILGFFGVDVIEPTSWQAMIGRAGQGVWVCLYIALLAFSLYHGLFGLRNIIIEMTTSVKIERFLTRVLIVFGVIAFIVGTYVPVALWIS